MFRDESAATVNCVKDPVAHTLSEFIPNLITRQKSDPRVVYWMRWMMAQQGGAGFDPLYTVERQAAVGAGWLLAPSVASPRFGVAPARREHPFG